MSSEYLTILGILISILLFAIGYRSTISSGKIKTESANKKVIDTLLRRLILEGFVLKKSELEKLSSGVASDYSIRSQDILSEKDIINILLFRVIENDFIGPEQRAKLLEKLNAEYKVISTSEVKELPEAILEEKYEKVNRFRRESNLRILSLAIASVILPATFVLVSNFLFTNSGFSIDTLLSLLGVIIGGLGIITSFFFFQKSKKIQEVTKPEESRWHSGVIFEKEIESLLKATRLPYTSQSFTRKSGTLNQPFDFLIDSNNGKLIIEAKLSLNRMPKSLLRTTLSQLEDNVLKYQCRLALIVSKEPISVRIKELETEKVKMVEFKDLRSFIDQTLLS